MSRKPIPKRLGGAFRSADAAALGVGEKRLRGDDLLRPHRGLRSRREAADIGERMAHLALVMTPEQYFSHDTAARMHGIPLPARYLRSEKLHVSAPHPARAMRRPGVVGHQCKDAKVGVVDLLGHPVADALSTLCALASRLDVDDLVAAGDALLRDGASDAFGRRRKAIARDVLAERLTAFRGPGRGKLQTALRLMRKGSESRMESLLRLLIIRAGLPAPELNVDIFDEDGDFIGRGDLVYRSERTIVEYDGGQHGTDAAQYDRDITRWDAFIDAGWRLVRVRKKGVFVNPEETVARIRAKLVAGGWTPSP
ncbi:DUF559 domain-containing protein [Microbacteriaceae bacterium VKM Ac-2854]|nr:DUF559 domain-containing protein [Microbacteriaceae bacterium VKM Ac-2854]